MRNIKFILLSFIMLASVSAFAETLANVLTSVTVAQGKLEGVEEQGLGVFKAIPYAEPPVGDLRWKAPVPKKSWTGVYRAEDFAPMPPQEVRTFGDQEPPKWSEDCLYLSVMTPAKSATEKLSVMVWIHGGGFITGSYTNPMGFNLAHKGVILVSIAYRTGALGFLALPELSKESEQSISGNYGLMDQILALEWIKENIATFGGDPNKVTIFGESAGAIAVSMLCASPLAKGLFRGAISESGGSFCPVDSVRHNNNGIRHLKGAEQHGVAFMKRIGAKNLKQLRKMSADAWISDKETTGVGGFWPTVDGYVITDDQYKLYEKGEFNDVNVIVGTNSDEGSMFVRPCLVAEYEGEVHRDYGLFADRILQLYPARSEQETFAARSDIFRETAFAWPSFAWARLQGEKGKSDVFVYYFDQITENPWMRGPQRGAGHASELPYVFGMHRGEPTPMNSAMSELMMTYWTNFVKTGDPNSKGMPHWPVYDEDKATVMMFKDGAHLINVPNRPQLELMEEFFKWKREQ
ncbi:MAG: carboxylesterase family protein [Tannerellaceae bacterium]|jgi:para-nitrobenzyl esterase|nr:carboxylesterase family protein [Tannerellaceae bacterium]